MADEKIVRVDPAKVAEQAARVVEGKGATKQNPTFDDLKEMKMIEALKTGNGDEDAIFKHLERMELLDILQSRAEAKKASMISGAKAGNGNGDMEEALKRVIAPLNEEIAMLKRERDEERRRREQDERDEKLFERMRREFTPSKKGDEPDKIDKIIEEIKAERKSREQDSLKEWKDEVQQSYANLVAKMSGLERASTSRQAGTSTPQKEQSLMDKVREVNQAKKDFAELLGLSEKQSDKMSATDLIDYGVKKIPEIGGAVKTFRDLASDKDISDDVPPEEGIAREPRFTNINAPIDPKILKWLNEGHEKDGVWYDKVGIAMQSVADPSQFLSRAEIEVMAKTEPQTLFPIVEQTEEDAKRMPEPEPAPPEPEAKKPAGRKKAKAEEKKEEPPASTPEPGTAPNPSTETGLPEHIQQFLDSGKIVKDDKGTEYWVDSAGVYYTDDHAKPYTLEEMRDQAVEDPEKFWSGVQAVKEEIAASMKEAPPEGEQSGGEETA